MVWINLIVGYHALHNVSNYIATFFEPTSPTNIITNETIITQYSIKQVINIWRGVKGDALVKK